MSEDPRALDHLIESWSETSTESLAAGESGARRVEGASVRALRDIARIADFNRTLQRAESAAGPMPERWGDLFLMEHVRSGASADVYRAWDPSLRRDVALKLLRAPRGDSDGVDEARASARIRHPGVVTVFGAAEHDGRHGVWMEFVRGETLAERIERAGPLDALEVARIGAALAEALNAVHADGLVHGDVKPANVILEPGGRVVLTDFGLGHPWTRERRGAFNVSGTPLFLSPERLEGEPATPRSDQYALGVTLWFAATARYPYEAATFEQLNAAVASGVRAALREQRPELPEALSATIERATNPRAADRFPGLEALGAALGSRAHEPAARTPPRSRPALALAAAGVLLLAAVTWLLVPRPRLDSRDATTLRETPAAEGSTVYDVDATFVRRTLGGYEPLTSGDRVAPGDDVSLEFRSTQRAWVYVMNQDDLGSTFLLFPQPVFDLDNPLAADSTLVLPGPIAGRESAWKVTSRGGREQLLVIVSPAPVPELEADLDRMPAPRRNEPVRYAPVTGPTTEWLRGMGGITDAAPPPRLAAPTRAFDRFRALAGRESGVRGVWVRRVVFENLAP